MNVGKKYGQRIDLGSGKNIRFIENLILIVLIITSLYLNFVYAAVPSISNVLLNTTDPTNNDTNQNLTVYYSASDADADSIKNTTSWYQNGTPIMFLNMPFENSGGASDAVDYSGGGNNGTVTNAVWNATGGVDGKGAYTFDGSADQIDVGNIIGQTDQFTIMMWVRATNLGSLDTLVDKISGSNVNGEILLDIDASDLVRFIRRTGQDNSVNFTTGTTTFTQGSWYHIAAVYESVSSGGLRLYINGVQEGSDEIAGYNAGGTAHNLIIGQDSATASDFSGDIDDVMIFNLSLSTEQIKSYYANKTDLWLSNHTSANDIWYSCITPNDGTSDGNAVCSNNVTITAGVFPVVNTQASTPSVPVLNDNISIVANVTDPQGSPSGLVSVNFTLVAPNGTVVINNVNGTLQGVDNWSSTSYIAYDRGIWNYTINATDGVHLTNKTGSITIKYPIDDVSLNSTNSTTNNTNTNLSLAWKVYYTTKTVNNITSWFLDGQPFETGIYSFENGSNATFTKDYSGNSTNASVSGATYVSDGGVDGFGAYDFDGSDDYILGSDNWSIGTASNFSVSLWANLDSTVNTMTFVSEMGSENIVGQFNLEMFQSDKVRFQRRTNTDSAVELVDSSTSLSTGRWYHIVGVYTGSNLVIYINGKNDTDSSSYTTGSFTGNRNSGTYIGVRDDSFGQDFDGSIDEIRLYKHALTSAQVWQLYNNRSNIIVAEQTSESEVWYACLTPNYYDSDKQSDGDKVQVCSNNITVGNGLPAINSNVLSPRVPSEDSSTQIIANVTDFNGNREVRWVNFTLIAPNNTKVIDHVNGSLQGGTNADNWSSSVYNTLDNGTWIWTINASDNNSAKSHAIGSFIVGNKNPVINSNVTSPTIPVFNGNVQVIANVTDDDGNLGIKWVNFTLISPNGTKVIDHVNGTLQGGDNWSSTSYLTQTSGIWIWTINASDNSSALDHDRGIFVINNTAPIVSNVRLNSSDPTTNYSNKDIILSWNVSDANGNVVYNITKWYLNNQEIELLVMPFQNGTANAATLTKDYSGNSNNGTVDCDGPGTTCAAGLPTYDSDGGVDNGGAYIFHGTDQFINLTNKVINGSRDFSISLWIKPNDSTSRDIMDEIGSENTEGQYLLSLNSAGAYSFIRRTGVSNGINEIVSSTTATVGVWDHVVVTYSTSNGLGMYVDGGSVGTTGSGLAYAASRASTTTRLGKGIATDTHFDGVMDNILVFDRVLSSAQVLNLYNNNSHTLSSMIGGGDVWHGCIITNDGFSDSGEKCSNNITIVQVPSSGTGVSNKAKTKEEEEEKKEEKKEEEKNDELDIEQPTEQINVDLSKVGISNNVLDKSSENIVGGFVNTLVSETKAKDVQVLSKEESINIKADETKIDAHFEKEEVSNVVMDIGAREENLVESVSLIKNEPKIIDLYCCNQHTFTLLEFNDENAILQVESEKIIVKLSRNKIEKVDLDKDGTNDIEIFIDDSNLEHLELKIVDIKKSEDFKLGKLKVKFETPSSGSIDISRYLVWDYVILGFWVILVIIVCGLFSVTIVGFVKLRKKVLVNQNELPQIESEPEPNPILKELLADNQIIKTDLFKINKIIPKDELTGVVIPKDYYNQVSISVRDVKGLSKQVKDTKNVISKKSKLEGREVSKWNNNLDQINKNILQLNQCVARLDLDEEAKYISKKDYTDLVTNISEVKEKTKVLLKDEFRGYKLNELNFKANEISELIKKLDKLFSDK